MCASVFGADVFAEEKVTITKIVKESDSLGDTWYAIKCTVKNSATPGRITVILQAVDSEGFEICSQHFTAIDMKSDETKTITDKGTVPQKDYKRIAKWQIKNIIKRD